MFINEKQLKGDSLYRKGIVFSEAFICDKAIDVHSNLVKKTLVANSKDFDFKASRGWFEKCIKSGIHIVLRHGEAVCSNKKEEVKF